MRSKVFSQLDTRWCYLPYPTKRYNIGTSGCGCCSVTNVIIERDKYKNYTPKNVQPYMKQFAVPGQGTLWSGITKSLKHYGFTTINHPTMTDLFKTLAKRKVRLGIILFRSGVKGGIRWTTSGHYVAFTDYKVIGKKHYFYTKDSGGRKHTGWYCYETQMKGLIPQVWSALPPTEKKKAKAKPKASANGKKLADVANKLAYKTKTNEGRYPTGKPDPDYKKALNKVYPHRETWSAAPRKGASCDVFVGTCVRTAGIDSKYPRGLSSQVKHLAKSDKFKEIKNATIKDLVDGDIIVYCKDSGGGHTCIYSGSKIKEASLKHWYGITTDTAKSRVSKKGKKWVRVYRAK